MKELMKFGIIPIDFNVLTTALSGYQSPKDKISLLENNGVIIRIKKGLYVVSSETSQQTLSRELVANHLYGPSYISLESALSFYGLIPERVYTVRSVTTKRAKRFATQLGNFEYMTIPQDYYSIGIRQEIVNNEYAYLIASPEKAICDMILSTRNFRIQSIKAMQVFLEEDLRIDLSVIKAYNTDIIKSCIETGIKKTELTQLLKLLEQ
jgi:predicted transcriptional regulator of viral defense system